MIGKFLHHLLDTTNTLIYSSYMKKVLDTITVTAIVSIALLVGASSPAFGGNLPETEGNFNDTASLDITQVVAG